METMAALERLLTTRSVMRLFMGSVAVNAVLGIWALLAGDFGDLQGRVLVTSFLVSGLMLGVLVHVPAIGRRALWPVPAVGAATAVAGIALAIVAVWIENSSSGLLRTIGSLLVVAGAAALASNLAIIGLADRYQLVRSLTVGCIVVLAGLILFAIWNDGADNDWFGRLIGVVSILVAAGTLVVPALSRFAPPDGEGATGAGDPATDRAVRFCPSCGSDLPVHPLGSAATCSRCGLTFEVLEAATAVDPVEHRRPG